ncbi:MAG TPA: permease [Candidatus Dojkabacteria bacterium]|nr:permease [Candidatus Dojkabacteria bacterium]
MDIFYPVQLLADFVSGGIFNLAKDSYTGSAINFFVYDSIKIGLLLIVINYVMAIVRYYLPIDKLKNILTSRKWYGLDYLLAAILGVITPFCSCSSIPLFIGFLSAGVPIGVTFTFLIASPLINESSLILFPAMFGMKTTIIYNLIGVVVSVLGGMLIQKLHVEKYVNADLLKFKSRKEIETENEGKRLELKKLLKYFWIDGWKITKSIFPYVLLGVAIGAIIHGYIPASLIEKYLSTKAWWVVPVATLLGIPLYANSVSVIPVMEALIEKGIPLGTALAFMTATVTLSIPEALILKKAMNWKLLAIFFGITILGIMLIGYLLNIIRI